LLLLVVALILGVERFMAVMNYRREFILHREKVWEFIKQGQYQQAIVYCDQHPGMVTELLKVGVFNIDTTTTIWNSQWRQVAQGSFNRIKSTVHLIALMANVAPLLGILATMVSLTVIYHAAYMRSNALNH
jgi:biopolymer transport protein ExbB/TolQ